MRKCYNSTRLNLPGTWQQRVGQVQNGTNKIFKFCLFLLLFVAGLAWVPTAKAQAVIWMDAAGSPTGASQSYASGNLITYNINIQNTGTTSLSVTVKDTLPANTTFYGASGSVTPDANGVVTWTTTVAAGNTGQVSMTVTVGSTLTGVAYINNTAYVDYGSGLLPAPGTKGATYTSWPAIRLPVDNGQNSVSWLSVSYAGSASGAAVSAETVLTYTVHVRNTGTQALSNVAITATVPTYTSFVSADNAGTVDANGNITWPAVNIAAGASDVTRQYLVRVSTDLTGASSIINTAYVDNGNGKGKIATYPAATGDANNPNTTSNTGASTTVALVTTTSFDTWMIVLNENTNTTVSPGDVLTYYIYVRNTGNITIAEAQVNNAVPLHCNFSIEANSVYDGGTYLEGSGSLVWKVYNLVAGQTTQVRYSCFADEDLSGVSAIQNTANVSTGDTVKQTMKCDPNDADCDGTSITSITVKGDRPGLFVSNVVTPNGDGKNDYFYIRNLEDYEGSKIYIFNRWGAQVYHSENYQNDWKAAGLAEGTYYYRLDLHNTETDTYTTYKGWVMIIR